MDLHHGIGSKKRWISFCGNHCYANHPFRWNRSLPHPHPCCMCTWACIHCCMVFVEHSSDGHMLCFSLPDNATKLPTAAIAVTWCAAAAVTTRTWTRWWSVATASTTGAVMSPVKNVRGLLRNTCANECPCPIPRIWEVHTTFCHAFFKLEKTFPPWDNLCLQRQWWVGEQSWHLNDDFWTFSSSQ